MASALKKYYSFIDNFIRTYTTNAETFGIEYDYKSIMHYSPYSGSKDPTKMTIVPTDPALTAADVGNGDKPTEKDFMKLNLLYECGMCFLLFFLRSHIN